MLRGMAPYTLARPLSREYNIAIAEAVAILQKIDLSDPELLRSATVGAGVFNWTY
jgi:hypothetical protein